MQYSDSGYVFPHCQLQLHVSVLLTLFEIKCKITTPWQQKLQNSKAQKPHEVV
jgi:hypothetical protein